MVFKSHIVPNPFIPTSKFNRDKRVGSKVASPPVYGFREDFEAQFMCKFKINKPLNIARAKVFGIGIGMPYHCYVDEYLSNVITFNKKLYSIEICVLETTSALSHGIVILTLVNVVSLASR
jgi:hypothetical protein